MKIPENPPTEDGYYWMLSAPGKFRDKGDWEIVRLAWNRYLDGEREAFVYLSEADEPEMNWDDVQRFFSEMEGPIVRLVPGENQG